LKQRISANFLYLPHQETRMPSNHKGISEKNSNPLSRRLRRLIRKLLWTNNHISRPRRPKPHLPNPVPVTSGKRRRKQKSFWRNLFGKNKDWQTKLTGEQERIQLEKEAAFIFQPRDKVNIIPQPLPKKSRDKVESGFFKRLSKRPVKQEKKHSRTSEVIRPQSDGTSHTVLHHRKKKTGLFKQIFGKKEKKPPKFIPAAEKLKFPKEKELIVYKEYVPYFINSTMLFMLAYLVAWLTYQTAVIITSSFFHIDSVLFFFEVMFPVGNSSEVWNSFNIILITVSGPITSIVAGTMYYVFLVRKGRVKGNTLMFFNWLIIHSYCMFFAAFVAGVITNQGFGYVANWLYMNVFFKILFSLIFLFFLSWISYRSAGHILETSNSVFRIKPKNRITFLVTQTVLPWFIGTLLLIAIKYPRFTPQHENILVYDLIIIICVLFMVIPPFFNKHAQAHLVVEKERKQTRINKRYILIAVMAILIFRVGLAGGIHFIIHLSVSISRYFS
jgi:hypothetical protein